MQTLTLDDAGRDQESGGNEGGSQRNTAGKLCSRGKHLLSPASPRLELLPPRPAFFSSCPCPRYPYQVRPSRARVPGDESGRRLRRTDPSARAADKSLRPHLVLLERSRIVLPHLADLPRPSCSRCAAQLSAYTLHTHCECQPCPLRDVALCRGRRAAVQHRHASLTLLLPLLPSSRPLALSARRSLPPPSLQNLQDARRPQGPHPRWRCVPPRASSSTRLWWSLVLGLAG